METEAERRILAQIQTYYPRIAECLEKLEPLEAFALMGNIMADTIARFPPEERVRMTKAWVVTLMEAVRDGIGIAKAPWRD
jgi:hypothetical protein